MQLKWRLYKLRKLLFFEMPQPIIRIIVVLILSEMVFLHEYKPAIAGECLDSKEQMLKGYKDQIVNIVNNPASLVDFNNYGFGWISYCWKDSIPNDDVDQELGEFLISVFENAKVPQDVKIKSLDIARYTAFSNIFPKMVQLLKQSKNIEEYNFIYVTLLNIWVKHAKTHTEIAQFNYISLLKETSPAVVPSGQKSELECKLYWAMSKVYPFDYPIAKKILQKNNFFRPTTCYFGLFFQDPRAFEDAGFKEYNYKSKYFLEKSAFFASLIRHLELEFKRSWLERLGAEELRELRNGIIATYGWKFKDAKLKSLFNVSDHLRFYCRNGKCNKATNNYNDNLLTDVDKKNIALIQEIEKNAPLHYPIIDPMRLDPPLPYQLQDASLL